MKREVEFKEVEDEEVEDEEVEDEKNGWLNRRCIYDWMNFTVCYESEQKNDFLWLGLLLQLYRIKYFTLVLPGERMTD